jgi:uncharacterized protein YndB with AHSA1/START domain
MVRVCPTGEFAAPPEAIWAQVEDPRRFETWADGKLVGRAEPDGLLVAGQRFVLASRALGLTFRVPLEIVEASAEKRRVAFVSHLPFGMVNRGVLSWVPLENGHTRLSFG